MDCIFCKIVKNEIPSYTIYENNLLKCFLDINPTIPGHTLIIPKTHFADLFEMDEVSLKQVLVAAKLIGQKIKDKLHSDGINLLNANGRAAQQSIFHFHMHIIPRFNNDGMNLWFHGQSKKSEDLEKVFNILNSNG